MGPGRALLANLPTKQNKNGHHSDFHFSQCRREIGPGTRLLPKAGPTPPPVEAGTGGTRNPTPIGKQKPAWDLYRCVVHQKLGRNSAGYFSKISCLDRVVASKCKKRPFLAQRRSTLVGFLLHFEGVCRAMHGISLKLLQVISPKF